MSAAKSAVALLLDLLVVIGCVVIAAIALTGGGTYEISGVTIRSTSVANPVVATLALALVRGYVAEWRPYILWFPSLKIRDIESRGTRQFLLLCDDVDAVPASRLRAVVAVILAASIAFRLLNVFLHPGFVTGDDVEVQEMAIGKILGRHWSIWNLRSPLYPMTFLFPVQKLVSLWMGADPASLVAAGRLVVVAAASIAVWLVFRITSVLAGQAAALLAMLFFASSRLHLWFGSSELPRPVASVFILLAFLMLLRRGAVMAVLAGILLAVGGCLRFGELVFFAPALLCLAIERRWRNGVTILLVGGATTLALLAVTDWLFWGQPFYSWRNAFVFTVTDARSTRGLQPSWYYLLSFSAWTNAVVLALSLWQIRLGGSRAVIWAWVPIAILSLLPHKESRYVIAAHPFVCIAAATAAMTLLRRLAMDRRRLRYATALALCIVAGLVVEAGDWRFRRTDRAVAFAQELATRRPRGVAAQELWRLGGRLYLASVPLVVELPDDGDQAVEVAASAPVEWVLLRDERTTPGRRAALSAAGFGVVPQTHLEYVVLRRR